MTRRLASRLQSAHQSSLQRTEGLRQPHNRHCRTDDASPFALPSTRDHPRRAVRQGATSCRSGAVQLPSRRGGRFVTARSRHGLPSTADAAARARGGLGRVAGGRRRRGRRGCPDAGHAVRRAVRVLCPPCGRTSVQLVGRTSGVQGERCPRDRGDLGVRTDRRPVSAASAAALSAPRWIRKASVRRTGHVGVRGWSVDVVGEWLGRRCPSRVWRGRGWSGVGSAWLARVSTADLGRRLACVQAAAPRSPPG
jgi:hypothetical protein